MSATRAEVIDYLRPILIDYIRVVGGRGRPEVDPWGFLLPLAPMVWVAILTMLLVLPLLVSLVSLTHPGVTRMWPIVALHYLRVLLQQNTTISNLNWWLERAMLGMWMLATLVLTKSYAGNLMSLLAVRHIPQPFQSIEDVLDDSSVTMIWEANTAYVQYIHSVEAGLFREVAGSGLQYVLGVEFPQALDTLVRRGSHVLMIEDLTATVFMANDLSLTGHCDFYRSRASYLPYIFSMIASKDSPLVPAIDSRLRAVSEGGLYEHWLRAAVPNSTTCLTAPSTTTVKAPLSLANIQGMFLVLAVGLAFTGLAFLLEVGVARLTTAPHDPPQP